MAIRTVIEVEGQDFELTLSRDDAGRYVAEAVGLPGTGPGAGRRLRVAEPYKERALRSLMEQVRALAGGAEGDGLGPGAPPAA